MSWLINLVSGGLLSGLAGLLTPVFNYLNARVDSDLQKHIIDTKTIGEVGGEALKTIANADNLNAQVRMKEGNWGPTTIMMALVLAPLIWHEWQVVLDSSRWVPAVAWFGWLPYVTAVEHYVGSWKVAALPDPWGPVELAIFQSFFIGATAAVSAIAIIKTLKR